VTVKYTVYASKILFFVMLVRFLSLKPDIIRFKKKSKRKKMNNLCCTAVPTENKVRQGIIIEIG
jgi:hypothetical protein